MAEEEVVQETAEVDAADQASADKVTPDGSNEDVAPKTVMEDTSDKPAAAPADWPEDWRSKLAGDDAKALKAFERFKSPNDMAKSLLEAQKKISSGATRPQLAEGATEEQVAEYRKALGVPDTPDGYLEKINSGLVIGDDDKPLLESFLASAHGKNAPPEFVESALEWYYDLQEKQTAEQSAADSEAKRNGEDALRAEWGGEFRANINAITAFLDTAPTTEDGTPLKDLLMGARLSDGTALGNHPDALRWLSNMASESNPAGFVSPGAGGSQAQSVDDEIASIQKVMRSDRATYDKDPKMQARLLTLLDAQAKLSARAA